MNYVINILIAIDQLINSIFCGHPDETLSARAYRLELERGRSWPRKLIDTILFFDTNHCKESFISEINRKQLSSKYEKYNDYF